MIKLSFHKLKRVVNHLLILSPAIFFVVLVIFSLSFLLCNIIFPFSQSDYKEKIADQGALILNDDGNIIDMRVGRSEQYAFNVPLEKISNELIRSTIAVEDKRFYEHHGVDIISLCRALYSNIGSGKRVSGASTITMQTVRLIHRYPRTYTSKIKEIFLAIQLENHMEKNMILEWYLNLAPYGSNIIGIEAASRKYFSKPSKYLSLSESVLLAGIPKNPNKFNPIRKPQNTLKRRHMVLRHLVKNSGLDKSTLERIDRSKLRLNLFKRKRKLMLRANTILSESSIRRGIIHSSLKNEFQNVLEGEFDKWITSSEFQDIDAWSALIIDSKHNKIIAIKNHSLKAPWLNLASCKRQVGSMLKPFIYGCAFEKGWLLPETLVDDNAQYWGEYRPKNHDGKFFRQLSVKDALKYSRNLPIIKCYNQLGSRTVEIKFKKMDLDLSKIKSPGLSLSLGSVSLSPMVLANAYSSLLSDGDFHPLTILNNPLRKEQEKKHKAWSSASSHLILNAMGAQQNEYGWHIAAKTGTSWNHRDAWAVALSPRYVVLVWAGRLNGKGHESLSGGKCSLPLAINILNKVSLKQESWTESKGIVNINVCSISKKTPSIHCNNTEYIKGIKGISKTPLCQRFHQKSNHNKLIVFEEKIKLTINHPIHQSVYLTNTDSIDLWLETSHYEHNIYWYLNGKYIKKTEDKLKSNFTFPLGKHTLTAYDGQNTHNIHFEVQNFRTITKDSHQL